MNPHQPRKMIKLPKIWLMTDERNDHVLKQNINNMPRGSGLIFRHYHLDYTNRAKRFAEISRQARSRAMLVILADDPQTARRWGADGVHGRQWTRRNTAGLLHTAPVHNGNEIRSAKHNGADLFFLSPIFPTQSHKAQKPLNSAQIKRLTGLCDAPVILLGGMDRAKFNRSAHFGAHGWAAIDGLNKK